MLIIRMKKHLTDNFVDNRCIDIVNGMSSCRNCKMLLNRIIVLDFILKILLLLIIRQLLINFPGSFVLTDMMISIFGSTKRLGPIFGNVGLCTLAFFSNSVLFSIVDTELTSNRANFTIMSISLQNQQPKLNNMLNLK